MFRGGGGWCIVCTGKMVVSLNKFLLDGLEWGWAGYPALPDCPAGYPVIRQENAGYPAESGNAMPDNPIRHPARKNISGPTLEQSCFYISHMHIMVMDFVKWLSK